MSSCQSSEKSNICSMPLIKMRKGEEPEFEESERHEQLLQLLQPKLLNFSKGDFRGACCSRKSRGGSKSVEEDVVEADDVGTTTVKIAAIAIATTLQ